MNKNVKMFLNDCGSTIAECIGEDCTKVLDLSHEEILQELARGMIATLKDDSPAIYEIFLTSNNTIVKLNALEKIHNEDFLKKYISEEYVHSDDCVRMKVFGKIEDKDFYEIITSDSYNIKARRFFVSKIKDKKYLKKIIKESKDLELIYEAMFCLNFLE